MKLRPVFATLIALVAVASVSAQSVQKVLEGHYKAMDKAATKKDAKSMLAMMTPDFKYKSKDGKTYTRAETEQQMKMQFQMAKSIQATTKIASIKVSGTKAVVSSNQKVQMVVANPQTSKTTKIDVTSQTRDTWVKQGSAWKLSHIETIKDTMKVDGKDVNLSGKK